MNRFFTPILAFLAGNIMMVSAIIGFHQIATTTDPVPLSSVGLVVFFMLCTGMSYIVCGFSTARAFGQKTVQNQRDETANLYDSRSGSGPQPVQPAKDYAED